ncbi:MAG: LPS export ABC transporter periplasmic protein LptC [Deltaproteobacteria bacterium]|nr:LPS export ABC transporter periplasmic protein LptC [Deltaproteobacteria bacterium]
MSREQMRFVVAVAATLVFIVVGYYLTVTLRAQRHSERQLKQWAADLSPEAAQRMQNFRRTKIRDGKKVWEIAARQASYSEDSNEILVEAPEVSLYLSDGEVIALRCQEGRVHLDSGEQEVTRMELIGNLEIRIGDFSVKTPAAVYESEHNTISSPGPVQITGRGFSVEGQGYTVDVTDKRLTLNADVRTTVTREEG